MLHVGAIDLDVIEKRLRALKDNDLPFGGVFVVFGADFARWIPCRPFHSPQRWARTTSRIHNVKGIELWHQVCAKAAVFTL